MKAVNIGLSVMWGDCNIGAQEVYQEGYLYRWKDILSESACDLAEKTYGSGWQVPTKEHIIELMQNCEFEFVPAGMAMLLQATGPNGNCIYLPLAGNRDLYGNKIQGGFYWSSTRAFEDNHSAYQLRISDQLIWGYNHIDVRQSIRPIYHQKRDYKINYNKVDNPMHYKDVTFTDLKNKIENLCKKLHIRFNWSGSQLTNSSFRKFPVATSKQVFQLEQGNILGHGNITFIFSGGQKPVALLIEKVSRQYIDSVKDCGMVYGVIYASITYGEEQRPDLINKLDPDDILVWLL